MKVLLLSTVFLFLAVFSVSGQRCKDQDGSDVDWWIIMKYPKLGDDPNPDFQAGYGYVYADSNNPSLSTSSITLRDSSNGALPNTLRPMYQASAGLNSDVGYVHYDDEFNGKKYSSNGHTKGDLIFGSDNGLWLIHSVPRFPPAPPDSYEYPDYAAGYGQSMICITMDSSDYDDVGTQLQYNKPKIVAQMVPSALASKYPEVKKAADGVYIKGSASSQSSYKTLRSSGGMSFHSFAKTGYADMNLYEDFVEQHYGDGMYVETWRRDPKMPSFCSPDYTYPSMNVMNVTLDGRLFSYTKDHSKWGVFIDTSTFCIGDINRMTSQATRGGGTICAAESTIYNTLKKSIDYLEPCPR